MINTVIISGYLSKFHDIRVTKSGKKMASFSLYQKQNGNAVYVPVVAFDRPAEFFEKYVKDGAYLEVKGRVSVSQDVDDTGRKMTRLSLIADTINTVGDGHKAQQTAPAEPPKQERYTDDMFSRSFEDSININPDDLPF